MPVQPLTFEAIGTSWQIDLDDSVRAESREAVLQAVLSRIDAFDRVYSRFREDSLVTEISRRAGTFTLPDDAAPMMAVYRKLYELTEGRLTPLIGQVMVDAGYDAKYSLKPSPLSRPPRWDDVMRFEAPHLELRQPALLDFGAAGKGYLIDIVAGVLQRHGVRSYCVDAGQDILYRSESGERKRIGLEHPQDFSKVIGVVELGNQSICGSAGNRRVWADYHHIIDPSTLASPRHLQATWVVAETALLADALATALFFVTPEKLAPHFDFEWLCLYPDFEARHSAGLRGELFVGG